MPVTFQINLFFPSDLQAHEATVFQMGNDNFSMFYLLGEMLSHGFQSQFRCRIATSNFSMGFNIILPIQF